MNAIFAAAREIQEFCRERRWLKEGAETGKRLRNVFSSLSRPSST